MLKLNEMKTILVLNQELKQWEAEKKRLVVMIKRIEYEMKMISIAKQAIANASTNDVENKTDS